MINCSIFYQYYEHALCDLGASVNIMPMVMYEKHLYPTLFPNIYVCAARRLYNPISQRDSQERLSPRARLLHPCRFRGYGYRRRPRNLAHSWATIPKGRQGNDRCRKRRNPFPHWEGEHVLQIQATGGATHPDWAGQRWACTLGFTRTPAGRTYDHKTQEKKIKESVAEG